MKRKIIFFAILTALAGLMVLQSCKKDKTVAFTEHNTFTVAEAAGPADGSTINIPDTLGTATLTWASTNKSGDAIKGDVYFGTSSNPALYHADNTALTLDVPIERSFTYYWYVVMRDAFNITVASPVFSFTVYDPINVFVGDYNADEPAEAYSYGVSFAMKFHNAIVTENYWNSGWEAIFKINFTANTYVMPHTVWGTYSGDESGTIDQTTGEMVGTYTIYHNGVSIETGTHTYTKL